MLELLYGSGMRVAELCGLDVDDLDLGRGVVTVTGKGAKQRQVLVHATLRGRRCGPGWPDARSGHGDGDVARGCAVLQRAGEPPRLA